MSGNVLNEFCDEFAALCMSDQPEEKKILLGQNSLEQLLQEHSVTGEMLEKVLSNNLVLSSRLFAIDPNDITLYREPAGLFFVRILIWEAGKKYPVHDHGAWGVVGCLLNDIQETKYDRLDDQSVPNYAVLQVRSQAVLKPGETSFVLATDAGIHNMEAVDKLAISIHAYSTPVRKGFIQCYLPEKNRVEKMFPLSKRKQILAARALNSLSQVHANEGYKRILDKLDDEIKREL
ncbi:MAG: Cysteine dioxygenase type I [Pelotomaculum sp. PtaB.Bin104]|nr:MAG: Cysteine dioxygenase type I [Pelotomaculum sp. PtaB.Bin104]